MSKTFGMMTLLGAAALFFVRGALANTSLEAAVTGDLFLNIVDTTNNTSFLYDTGVSQASFNGSGNYTFNLAVDSNLKGFLNTSDTFDYSVISGTKNPATTIDFTGGANATFPTPLTPTAFTLNQALSPVTTFLAFANTVASTTTTSAVIPTGTANQAFWGAALNEGVLSAKLFNGATTPYADNAPLGTPLSFFQAVGSTLTTFTGKWNFSSATDLLTYGGSTTTTPPPPVPLPSSLLLLLSGLGLMGGRVLVSRGRCSI